MALGDDLRALARYEFELERKARKAAKAPRKVGGTCAYCGEPGTDLVTDHDHETGQIRGLVHRSCNAKIGSHTASNVPRLADYLNRTPNLGPYRQRERE
jgi:Recombination endonuclease VII